MSERNKKRTTKTEDALFKIIMVGKSAVGKSSLLTRYTKNIFQNDYQVTVGINNNYQGV
jgi:GTPase SAR1 family protein